MDVFAFREELISEYERFSRSFTNIRAADIDQAVDEAYAGGRFWPVPLIQLNPNFVPGGSVDELVSHGTLDPECGKIFRRLVLYRHQTEAIEIAQARWGKDSIEIGGTTPGKAERREAAALIREMKGLVEQVGGQDGPAVQPVRFLFAHFIHWGATPGQSPHASVPSPQLPTASQLPGLNFHHAPVTTIRPETGFQKLGRCETVLQERFDWQYLWTEIIQKFRPIRCQVRRRKSKYLALRIFFLSRLLLSPPYLDCP